jgi:hypothetical protein
MAEIRTARTTAVPDYDPFYDATDGELAGMVPPRPVPTTADRMREARPRQQLATMRQIATDAETEAERGQAHAERDRAREYAADNHGVLEAVHAALDRAGHQSAVHGPANGIARLATDLDRARRTIASQAEQIRRNGTLLVRLRDLDEQRDRAWADHDTVSEPEQADGAATCHADDHDHSTSSCLGPAVAPVPPARAQEVYQLPRCETCEQPIWPGQPVVPPLPGAGPWEHVDCPGPSEPVPYREQVVTGPAMEALGRTLDPDVTRLLVTVEWHGDYYHPGERVDMLTSWIESALDDRDDSPSVTITEHAAPELATGGMVRPGGTRLAGEDGCAIAPSNRFATAAGHPGGPDWVSLRTGSGRQYEGHRSPSCPGDGQPGHQHDIRCVEREG